MTKKETRYIEQKILKLLRWASEEDRKANMAQTAEEKNEHKFEAEKLRDEVSILNNLLIELENLKSHT